MWTPLVSVIINNYNHSHYLKTAIDSVLAQTYPHVEIIVVDDGSTDDSAEVIRSHGDRLRALFKRNGGQGSCFNAGFAASRGELVLFLDADDAYLPEAVAQVVEAARSGAVLIQFQVRAVDAEGRLLFEFPQRLDSGDVVPLLLSQGHFTGMVTSANAFRRDALQQVLPLPEDVYVQAADGYLINTVAFLGRVAAINRPLACYRLHGRNDSQPGRGAAVDLAQVRRRLGITTRELALVHTEARKRRLHVPRRLPWRYMGHLQLRLVSRKLEPARHPFGGDSPWALGFWGARAALGHRALGLKRRVLMAGWFVLVGASPLPMARELVTLMMVPGARRARLRQLASGLASWAGAARPPRQAPAGAVS